MSDNEKLISEIKKKCTAKSLTPYEINKYIDVSVTSMRTILNGTNTSPRKETLLLIKDFLDNPTKYKKGETVQMTDEMLEYFEAINSKLDEVVKFIAVVYPILIDHELLKAKKQLDKDLLKEGR